MAIEPQTETTGPNIAEAFAEDRQIFWKRFTSFTTGAAIAIVILLVAMWLFLT